MSCAVLALGCDEPAGVVSSPLLARVDTVVDPQDVDSVPCTPFQAAYYAQAADIARAVVNAPAFEACVAERMTANYIQEDDPDLCPSPPCTRQEQIDAAWTSLQTAPHVEAVCAPVDGAWVDGRDIHPEFNATSDTRRVHIGTQWREDYPDWDAGGAYTYNLTHEPWSFRVDEYIHELMHTSGYVHCDENRAEAQCSPGYVGGENSAPYIYSICAYEVLELSGNACGDILTSRCARGSVRIISDWDSPNSCSCVPMSGDTWALSNQAGWYVTSVGGGGGDARADRQYRGSWENLHIVDRGGTGDVSYGDVIGIRSNRTRDWFIVSASNVVASGSYDTSSSFKIHGFASGPIGIGSQVFLQDVETGLWMRTQSSTGGDLIAGSSYQFSTGMFKVERPVRSELVYLRGAHGRYISRSGTSLVNVSVHASRDSAFWVLDHNGGYIRSGDEISFEGFELDKWIRSPGGDSTRADILGDAIRAWTRYVIVKISGSSSPEIQHGDIVALRSVSLNLYLTAMPHNYFNYQVLTYGTTPQAWQQFVWNRVSQFDQARPQFDQYVP